MLLSRDCQQSQPQILLGATQFITLHGLGHADICFHFMPRGSAMKLQFKHILGFCTMVAGLAFIGLSLGQTSPASATPSRQADEALIARGEYLANVGACIFCHTPFAEQYTEENPDFGEEEIRTLALREVSTLDLDRIFSGGHPFNLGPQGVIYSANLTPHEETGIGGWSDEELKTALRTGIRPDGTRIHPLMPAYNTMADADLEAIVAFLRSVAPVENEVPPGPNLPIPGMPPPEAEIVAPDPSDQSAYGQYLVNNILVCSHCHTPVDPETGAPLLNKYLAGGQPYQDRYGVVYAANLTPHETGLGNWTEDEIKRAMTQGVRINGRRLALMPWQLYARLSPEDLDAVVHYLMNDVPPVDQLVPPTALEEPYLEFVDVGQDASASSSAEADEDDEEEADFSLVIILAVIGVVVFGAALAYIRSRRKPANT
jgi:mono/diheme cytochrome c family protein